MRKFVLISLAVVSVFIVIITIISMKNVRRSSYSRNSPRIGSIQSKLVYNCKKHNFRSRVFWNYFYYYHNKKSDKSLLWCKIPKTGSTTMTRLFLHLAGASHILKKNTTRIHKTLREFYPRLSTKNLKRRLQSSYKFIIVRHPFDRILSAYRDKLESYQRDLDFRDGYYYNRYGRFMKTSNSSRKEPSWTEFVSYLIKTPMARFDQHWMPMTRLCSPCNKMINHYDAIIKLENMSQEITNLFRKVGITFSPSKISLSHRTGSSNQSEIIKYFEQLKLDDLKKLHQKYKNDFTFFGYTPFKYYRLTKS